MIYIKPEKIIAGKSEIIACAKKYLEKNSQLDLNEFISNDMKHSKASSSFILDVANSLIKNPRYKMEIREGRYFISAKRPVQRHLLFTQFKSAFETAVFSIKPLEKKLRRFIKRSANYSENSKTTFFNK
jgi:hypothetical protein